MKKIILVSASMLLVLGCLLAGFVFHIQAGRYFTNGVVYVAPRLNYSYFHFDTESITNLTSRFPGFIIAPESRSRAQVSTAMQDVVAGVVYTNAYYFGMHNLDFVDGDASAVVVNSSLAWRLFGTLENTAGNIVWINDRSFFVSGVVKQGGPYTVWVVNDYLDEPVFALYIIARNPDPLTAYRARDMLTFPLWRNPADYAIVNVDRFVESIGMRNRVLLYITLLLFAVACLWFAWRKCKGWGAAFCFTAGMVAFIFVVFGVHNILSWLPNMANTSLFEIMTGRAGFPPDGYLPYGLRRLNVFNRYANYVFVVGIAGLFCAVIFLCRKR